MSGRVSKAPGQYTLEELKRRGDRAVAEGREAARLLGIALLESHNVRHRIDLIHHGGPQTFEGMMRRVRAV